MLRRLLGKRAAGENLRRGIVANATKCSRFTTSSSQEPHQPSAGQDPYNYTSGRWLHRDQLQLAARFIQFDFPALCQKVLSLCPGSGGIIKYEKKEGGFNRVFIFHMANGARIIARLSFRGAGPERLTTHSEVATMAYIREHTDIPVPKVLEWSDNKANSIGAEYIIMDHAPGVQLHGRWPTMNIHQHMLCVKSLARLVKSMATLLFPAYGSIYFADVSIDPKLKVPLGDFCIGPHCGREYWDCTAGEARYYQERKPDRGPWLDLAQYTSALLDAGHSRIPSPGNVPRDELPYRGSVEEHLRLLKVSEGVITQLVSTPVVQDLTTPILLHADLHKRNIFVAEDDPTVITSVIDWQSTSVEPALALAFETPDLIPIRPPPASVSGEAAEIPPTRPDDDSETVKARKREEKDVWICRQTFEVIMKASVPRLFAARATDENLLRPFRYCSSSWRDSAFALRQELIELSQQWTELKLPGVCPYQPTTKELVEHENQREDFEGRQKLKLFLIEHLQTDSEGWVPTEVWESSKELHKEAFDTYMEQAKIDPDMTVVRAEKLWPFDMEKEANK